MLENIGSLICNVFICLETVRKKTATTTVQGHTVQFQKKGFTCIHYSFYFLYQYSFFHMLQNFCILQFYSVLAVKYPKSLKCTAKQCYSS